MKKIAILGALALGVGVMVVAVWMASTGGEAKASNVVCHYDGGKITQNKVHEQHSWSIVEVGSANALAKHLANHEDPAGVKDAQISQGACDTRDAGLAPLVADGPPGQD